MTTKESTEYYILLKLDIEAKNGEEVYFLKKTTYLADYDAEDIRYHIEEHTCPTNVVPVRIIALRDTTGAVDADPHGILKYIDHITVEVGDKIINAKNPGSPQTHENVGLIHHMLNNRKAIDAAAEAKEDAELQEWMDNQVSTTTISSDQ